MNYKVTINDILVGEIKDLKPDNFNMYGEFFPSENFEKYKNIFDEHEELSNEFDELDLDDANYSEIENRIDELEVVISKLNILVGDDSVRDFIILDRYCEFKYNT